MEESSHQERYDSFNEYKYNYDIYYDIKGDISDGYNSFPYSVLGEETEYNESITKDCIRLRKYLLKFDNKEECQKKNCCTYVNYLLNDGIRKYYQSKNFIFEYYNRYMNDHSNQDIKILCGSEIKDMGKDKYEKTKKLYDLYLVYKSLVSSQTSITCSRAKSCAKQYNNIISDYPNLDDIKFCKALNDFKIVFERNEDISTGKCNDNIPKELAYSYSCNQLLQKLEKGASSIEQKNRQLEGQKESKGPLDSQEDQMVEVQKDYTTSPSSLSTTLPISLFSSGMGGLLILLSFYKFTPLGQWLKHRTRGFGGITKNFDEELYEMQQPTSEYDQRNSEYIGYNIAYNSL